MKKLIVLVIILIIFLGAWSIIYPALPLKKITSPVPVEEKVKIVTEESVITDIVGKVEASVVTVGVEEGVLQEQNIGSGFILSEDGLVVTNKHVVAAQIKYKVITFDGKKFNVEKIYRDVANDIAILKITPVADSKLTPVELGDSAKLKVGQLVVAMGTPLGEFRGSVTKGIISGLGRGIQTGSPFAGYIEQLDNVIQTDAAINPGNSGGPLINSAGQVIGINTAIASGAQNIGFAIPIDVVRESLKNFNETGKFSRPYLGVAYKIVTRDLAILNELPEGAFVQKVGENGPAQKANVKAGDIITKIDGQKVTAKEAETLAVLIAKKKIGDSAKLSLWREGKALEVTAVLQEAPGE